MGFLDNFSLRMESGLQFLSGNFGWTSFPTASLQLEQNLLRPRLRYQAVPASEVGNTGYVPPQTSVNTLNLMLGYRFDAPNLRVFGDGAQDIYSNNHHGMTAGIGWSRGQCSVRNVQQPYNQQNPPRPLTPIERVHCPWMMTLRGAVDIFPSSPLRIAGRVEYRNEWALGQPNPDNYFFFGILMSAGISYSPDLGLGFNGLITLNVGRRF